MATLTASTNFFPDINDDTPAWIDAIQSAFNGVTLSRQTQLDALFDGDPSRVDIALDSAPIALGATGITWAHNGGRVELTGTGFGAFDTLEELDIAIRAAIEAALNGSGAASTNGLGSLALNTFNFFYQNVPALSIGLGSTGVSVSSGNLSFDLVGAGPGSLNGIIDLLAAFQNAGDADTEADFEAAQEVLFNLLEDVGFTSFTLMDGATQLLALSLSDTQLRLTSVNTEIELNGDFPAGNFGALIDVINQIDAAEANGTPIDNLDQITGLGIDNLIIRENGAELLRVQGPFTDDASTDITQATITGTNDADEAYVDNLGVETGDVTYNMGAGNDRIAIDTYDAHFPEYATDANITLNGGAGSRDLLEVSDDIGFGDFPEFFNTSFFAAPADRIIAVDLGLGLMTGTFANNSEAPYAYALSGIEDVRLNVAGLFSFNGDAADNTLQLGYVGHRDLMSDFVLDGGAGAGDVLDLTQVQLGDRFYEGLTYRELRNELTVSRDDDDGVNNIVTLSVDGPSTTVFELRNFETIRVLEAGAVGSRDIAVSDLQIRGVDRTGTVNNDNILGSLDADTLTGGGGEDTLVGGGGDDLFIGGNPNALSNAAGGDTFIGGAGRDAVSYEGSFGSLRVDLQFSQINTFAAAGDTYDSIEDVIGSQGADNIRGNQEDNNLVGLRNVDYIFGRRGNDTLEGHIGDDVLFGGVGADHLSGGSNRDRAQYSESLTAVLLDLADASRNTGEAAGDVYVNIEDLAGSAFADTIYGDAGDNRLFGRQGADYLDGRSGDDYLNGGGGQDTLVGGAGDDVMRGGTSRDTFVFDGGNDIIEDWFLDQINLDRDLWGGADLAAADIISTYANVVNNDTVFDFGGGNTLTLQGQDDTGALTAYIFDV
ncbi:calcium-binding protein [Sulfitobacter sp. HNIBRBA2951]|uniref:calcium-binding protein n=1 Tax=Sulfitobacter aquimarinus TaxID=3158557 RepID=UPI0032DF9B29